MRTTVLMDAAYNVNNKWHGREFMKHNEALETVPEEQWGSRKWKKAAEVALKKVLAMDLLRQFRRAGFLCSNDAIQPRRLRPRPTAAGTPCHSARPHPSARPGRAGAGRTLSRASRLRGLSKT